MTALERQMAADAIALSKEHADRADAAEARWTRLREKVTYQRDVKRDQADREQDDRLRGAAEALDYVLATMDRMEADR